MLMFFFFFSSRRRHTRWTGDWSSDVCSSDLNEPAVAELAAQAVDQLPLERERERACERAAGAVSIGARERLLRRHVRADPHACGGPLLAAEPSGVPRQSDVQLGPGAAELQSCQPELREL